MPSWRIHVKWAVKYGIDEGIAELVNRLIDDPQGISDPVLRSVLRELERVFPGLLRHDWGKRSGAEVVLFERLCESLYAGASEASQCIAAVKLHHILDYIAYFRNPRNLARAIVDSEMLSQTRGLGISGRISYMRRVKGSPEYWSRVGELEEAVSRLSRGEYGRIILGLLEDKFRLWRVPVELQEFVRSNIGLILEDIEVWLGRRVSRRRGSQRRLDEYF